MVGSCVHAHVISPQPRRNLAAISRDFAPPCDPSPQTMPQSAMGFLCSYLKTTAAVDLPTHYLYLRTPLGLAPNILLPTRTTITSGVLEEGAERDHHTYTPLLVPHHTLLLPTIAAVDLPTPLLLHSLTTFVLLFTPHYLLQACWKRGRRWTTIHACCR